MSTLNIADGDSITFRNLTTLPIYNILAKGMFDLDTLPDFMATALQKFSDITSGEDTSNETSDDNNDAPVTDAMSDLANNCFNFLRGTYYAILVGTIPEFREARETYTSAAKKLIQAQSENIKSHISNYANCNEITNIFALSVIELFKEKINDIKIARSDLNQCLKYMLDDEAQLNELLNDDYIRTIPAVLMAALNLRGVIPSMLHALASNPELLSSLRNYLSEKNLTDDFSNMHRIISEDKKINGKLNQIYLEGLRLEGFNEPLEELQFSSLFRYYLDKPLKVGDTTIPANSVICILNGMNLVDTKIWGDKPETFDSNRFFGTPDSIKEKLKITSSVFSHAPRVCPGHNIAEYVSKAAVTFFAMNYDLEVVARPNESSITKSKLKLSKRNFEVDLDLDNDTPDVKKLYA